MPSHWDWFSSQPPYFYSPFYDWILAIIIGLLGVLVCFKGNDLIQPLVGVTGAGSGAWLGSYLAQKYHSEQTVCEDGFVFYVGCVVIASVTSAVLSLLLWKVALAQIAGVMGYVYARSLIANEMNSALWQFTILAIASLLPAAIVLRWSDLFIPLFMSAIGASIVILGYDIFFQCGLYPQLKSIIIVDQNVTSTTEYGTKYMLIGFVLLTLLGSIYQFLNSKQDAPVVVLPVSTPKHDIEANPVNN